ncbi:hypothetical protein I204_08111 [Kwoniella mangroviensis CBS 8886]|uniref:uncharacterized protein n=1 Tax=Kwoniella mangroviensis CBS 8507 TaxID=1296122 RepID=UPI00080D56C6|nr:uncharacterized protein I203_04529 [Kwoniella mangroviensis CBS 8507]OCF66203.1 hypothetical protein I203_04529 [Kwoniella mangroviensis CBS 8507]OCF71158.1 hypothetical protein I204_08111 [Kwoniella mangroviensis CBS 8886]
MSSVTSSIDWSSTPAETPRTDHTPIPTSLTHNSMSLVYVNTLGQYGCPHPTHHWDSLPTRISCISPGTRVYKLNLNNGFSNFLGTGCGISSIKYGNSLIHHSGMGESGVTKLTHPCTVLNERSGEIADQEIPNGFRQMCMDIISVESGKINLRGDFEKDEFHGLETLNLNRNGTKEELNMTLDWWNYYTTYLSAERDGIDLGHSLFPPKYDLTGRRTGLTCEDDIPVIESQKGSSDYGPIFPKAVASDGKINYDWASMVELFDLDDQVQRQVQTRPSSTFTCSMRDDDRSQENALSQSSISLPHTPIREDI